jgi:predicted AAA+ superfamily ATPase
MYSRIINKPTNKSFFLFGPRGTGKTTWVHSTFPKGLMLDLLDSELYYSLLSSPRRLEELIPPEFSDWIVIDEIQRIPDLLNEAHRLIENRNCKFVLTGSNARKLRQKGVNLLAGRAVTRYMHPLTAYELGDDFSLDHALRFGQLPSTFMDSDPVDYLESYIHTYLREEILQEGLTRNLQAFARFLEAASFSQAALLNVSAVARECGVNRKLVESYFHILDDLLLCRKLRVFTKRARRRMAAHPKFFFFDAGVYRALRPKGPLDRPEEIDGSALETLVCQELFAVNDNWGLGYDFYYWRTASDLEVDFILYGARGIHAIEVKRARIIRRQDLSGLKAFLKDYPMARGYLFYGGDRRMYQDGIELIPISEGIRTLPMLMNDQGRQ